MDGEIYQGGFRCAMCDWNDSVQADYSAFAWIVALIHSVVHSISALIFLK